MCLLPTILVEAYFTGALIDRWQFTCNLYIKSINTIKYGFPELIQIISVYFYRQTIFNPNSSRVATRCKMCRSVEFCRANFAVVDKS